MTARGIGRTSGTPSSERPPERHGDFLGLHGPGRRDRQGQALTRKSAVEARRRASGRRRWKRPPADRGPPAAWERWLPGRGRALGDDRPAALEGDGSRRLQQPGERLRRLEEMRGHVQGANERLVEETEMTGELLAFRNSHRRLLIDGF